MLDPSFLQSHELLIKDNDDSFISVAWETLSIIKENMPAHVEIGITENSSAAKALGFGLGQASHFQVLE